MICISQNVIEILSFHFLRDATFLRKCLRNLEGFSNVINEKLV